ncbi:hypothetical protein Tco_0949360 [Tanacetum coccineum]
MVVCEWHLRTYEEDVDEEHAYRDYPNNFSLKIHHGGYLSDYPNRRYKDGTCNYFDQVDVDLFSIVDLKDMLGILGNDETRNENYVEMENDEDSDIAKDIYSDMEVEKNIMNE